MPASRTPAPAVGRAVAVLQTLGAHSHALSLSELARLTGGAKSSTLAVLEALVDGGLARRSEEGYRLGWGTLELGGRLLTDIPEVRRFERTCISIPPVRNRLVRLAVLDGTDIVYLARHEGHDPTGGARVGDRLPAASTAMGRALLAGFSDTVVRARLESESAFARLTESSTTDAKSLIDKLRKVREAGFATEVGEIRPGVIGLGVSLPRSDDSAPRLAVGVSVVGSTVTSVDAQLVGALVELATRLADEPPRDVTSGAVQRAEHPRSVA